MSKSSSKKCLCEDSNGSVCEKIMTKREVEQDGMCSNCADNVWKEMRSFAEYKWYHVQKKEEKK